jgi:hypothetical protein
MSSFELKSINPMHSLNKATAAPPVESASNAKDQPLPHAKHDAALQYFLDKATSRNLDDFNRWLLTTSFVEEHSHADGKTATVRGKITCDNGTLLEKNNSSYTYQLPQHDPADPRVRYTQFISNWVQTWNYLMISDGDYFESDNRLFTAFCNYYFHYKTIRIMVVLTLYLEALYLYVMIAVPANASNASGPFIANILFLGAYLWGSSLYKGKMFRSTLTGDETRLARETITALSRNNNSDLSSFLKVGCDVLVKSYQQGAWVRGTIVRVHKLPPAIGGVDTDPAFEYDVQYKFSATKETHVKPQFVRLREGSESDEVGLFRVVVSEWAISVKLIVISTITFFYPVPPQAPRYTSSASTDSSTVEEVRTFLCGWLTPPVQNGQVLNEGWPRQSMTENRVETAINSDFTMLKDQVLKFYMDEPMSCGFWELLEWAMKYQKAFAKHDEACSALHVSITRTLTIIVAIAPFIILPVYTRLYYDTLKTYNLWGYPDGQCPDIGCEANFYFMVFTGVYSLLWLQSVFIFNALFIIFIGLLYGADAAHTLTKSWQVSSHCRVL